MSKPVKSKRRRSYRSVVRAEQAEETRRRIIEAARSVFIARGYAGATMTQVATEAGTAVETIYAAFGTKAELLANSVRAVLVVDGKPPHEQANAEAARAAPTGREQLRLFAADISRLLARVAPIFDVVASARREPEIGALYKRMQNARLGNLRVMVGWLVDKRGLRAGLDPDGAAETVWALTNPELYRMLTEERGWSREQFERWLGDTLIATIAAT